MSILCADLACDSWELIEVKSTTSVKRVHDLDLAVQVWVLRGSGIKIDRASVLTLDRGYLWAGGDYDLDALFRSHDRSEAVDALLPEFDSQVEQLQTMLDALGDVGSIVVYSDFEKRTIKAPAKDLPRLAEPLRALLPRLWDLHRVVRDNYYHPQFCGSFSIKSVLPALLPELSCSDLTIADGRLAAIRYEQELDSDDVCEREEIFAALREYCGRDTYALLRIREVLAQRVGAN
jgi:hypothetical protein